MTSSEKEPKGFLLEEHKRLSESVLWKLQRQYYDERGLSAWESGTVPSYVTSNSFIVRCYAEIVLHYLRDALLAKARGDQSIGIDEKKPIYILELAAGHGRFSFLFLKKFFTMLRASSLRHLDVRYVMSDFTENNLRSWRNQPLFARYVDAKVLEFALFDLERDGEIKLMRPADASGKSTVQVLTKADFANPLIVFANYIFDTLPHDVFRLENGQVQEGLVTTRHAQEQAPDLANPEIMSQFSMQWDYRTVDPNHYYSEPILNKILKTYSERLGDTTIGIPIASLRGILRLLSLCGNKMLLVSSDKGYTHEDELFFLTTQHIQFHGSLSMMVNYQAIDLLLSDPAFSGLSKATAERHINLKTAAFIVGGKLDSFRDTLLAFDEIVDTFGPYDFYTTLAQIRQSSQAPNLEQVLGLIRLSHYDPNVVLEYSKELLEQSATASDQLKVELHAALVRCWENFYPLGRDLPFEIARIFLAMRRPKEAVQFNLHSIDLFGQHPVTYGNMGICYYHAEQFEEALRCFDRSLELAPTYGLPKAWKARVVAESSR